MEKDDIIRRLKVLSKSQSAFLKAYCHQKLSDGVELVKEATKLLKASGFRDKDRKISEIYDRIELLDLASLEVDVSSAQLLMNSEMALLRNSVDGTLPPAPSSVSDPEANGKIQTLEADNKKLRDLLEKAKVELIAVAKASAATASPPPPPTPSVVNNESREEDLQRIQELEASLAQLQEVCDAKDNQVRRLELVCLQFEEDAKKALTEKVSGEAVETGRLKAELDNLMTKYDSAVASHEAKLKELSSASDKKIAAIESRCEKEKEDMMEAMAQEVEDVENTFKTKVSALETKIQEMTRELGKTQQGATVVVKSLSAIKPKLLALRKTRGALVDDIRQSFATFSSSLKTDLGESAGKKLQKILSDSLTKSTTRFKREVSEMEDRHRREMTDATERYKKEVVERKRLHNLVQELKGNIRVFMRARPPTTKELEQFGPDAVCINFPPCSDENEIRLVNEKGREKTWEFDALFGLDSKQEDIFSEVSALVTSVLDGYNVCIFAYGQTGSGKTHTMTGPPDDPGVNTRALGELFSRCAERAGEFEDMISISVLEVYNEEIRDLLSDSPGADKLEIRQSEAGNIVPGLICVEVAELDDVKAHLVRSDSNRASACTNMNEHSSRSHMILTVYIQSRNLITGAIAKGKLNLVDLAGSERVNKSGAQGQAMKEAQNINKSLSALGDVIQARGAKQSHVPFRNSTLTYLLQDSLSQDSKTLMFVCISPVLYNSEESFCSLNFASRVRSVELGKATKNITASGTVGGGTGGQSMTSSTAAVLAANRLAAGGTKSSMGKRAPSSKI